MRLRRILHISTLFTQDKWRAPQPLRNQHLNHQNIPSPKIQSSKHSIPIPSTISTLKLSFITLLPPCILLPLPLLFPLPFPILTTLLLPIRPPNFIYNFHPLLFAFPQIRSLLPRYHKFLRCRSRFSEERLEGRVSFPAMFGEHGLKEGLVHGAAGATVSFF